MRVSYPPPNDVDLTGIFHTPCEYMNVGQFFTRRVPYVHEFHISHVDLLIFSEVTRLAVRDGHYL